jgi:hypothetical protein
MFKGIYLRKLPNGRYVLEGMQMSEFLERVCIDFQFSREGDYIMNLQGGNLLGVFVPQEASVQDVIARLEDTYGFAVELG